MGVLESNIMNLINFFQTTETSATTHSWVLCTNDPTTKKPQDELAKILAVRIVEHQCRGAQHHFTAWKIHFDGGPKPPSVSQDALRRAFIGPVFGLPENPTPIDQEHLEGYVSQMLWYFLYVDLPPEEIVRLESPGFKSTDPGGDALAIHRLNDKSLMFRLWEIKKFSGDPSSSSSGVSSTINDAYNQLNERALEYLARYTAIGQEISADVELSEFYGNLVDLWLDAQREASAGVSVVTSTHHVPTKCFSTFGKQFPKFVDPVRLRGMLTAVSDFTLFSVQVRDYIWTGL